MKTIVINKYNLKEEDMTEVVKRVKILLINSKNEILLGYSHNTYQFPGGHVEENEELCQTIIREVEEETGIKLDPNIIFEPFAVNYGYYKDWPSIGKNRKIEIYYYEIKTDELPNLYNTNYTENEKNGGFELRYISLNNIEVVLRENADKYGDDKGIAKEMLELIDVYKEININR